MEIFYYLVIANGIQVHIPEYVHLELAHCKIGTKSGNDKYGVYVMTTKINHTLSFTRMFYLQWSVLRTRINFIPSPEK